MKTDAILKVKDFEVISPVILKEICSAYCCELPGMALGKLKENQAWITAAVNINTLAVAYQKKASCIIISENTAVDDEFVKTATQYRITVFRTKLPVYETAVLLGSILKNN